MKIFLTFSPPSWQRWLASISRTLYSGVILAILSVSILNPSMVHAQDPQPYQAALQQLLGYLSTEYSDIQALEKDSLIAQQNIVRAQAEFDPTLTMQLTGRGSLSTLNQTTNGSTTQSDINNLVGQTDLTFQQLLYDWDRTAQEITLAEQRLRYAELSVIQQRERIYFLAIQTYFATLRSIARIDILQKNIVSLERRVEEAEQRFNAGVSTSLDQITAQASLAQGHSDLSAANAQYQAIFNDLKTYAPEGFEDFLPTEVTWPQPPSRIVNITLKQALQEFGQYSTVLATARQLVQVAEADYAAAQELNNPEVSMSLNLSHQNSYGDTHGRQSAATASLNFSLPLITSRVNDSDIAVARETLAKRQLELRALRDQQASLVKKAWYEMRAFGESVAAARANFQAQDELLSRAEQSGRVGQASLSEQLDQQDKVRDAKFLLINTQHQYLIKSYELRYLIGLPLNENL